MEDTIKIDYEKGKTFIYPLHPMVKHWRFEEGQKEEAVLCHSMAVVAEKNGINVNDFQHLFPACLRMLKSNSEWA